MKFVPADIPGVWVIEPRVAEDERGFFFEDYNAEDFSKNGIRTSFVQDNASLSHKGVLRGLHYQTAPMAQAKLVRVVRGEVFDVVVDIRSGSRTFGRFVAQVLNARTKKMLYVPEGFAHGFLALEDDTEFLYKCSRVYSPGHERGIRWDDPALGIPWPKMSSTLLSERDKRHPLLKDINFGV